MLIVAIGLLLLLSRPVGGYRWSFFKHARRTDWIAWATQAPKPQSFVLRTAEDDLRLK